MPEAQPQVVISDTSPLLYLHRMSHKGRDRKTRYEP